MTVYGELVLLCNGAVDGALLYAVGRFLNLPMKARRLILAALLGAVYALGFFYWEEGFLYTLGGEVIMALLMVKVAFPTLKGRSLLVAVAYLWIFAALLGGMSFLLGGLRPLGMPATERTTLFLVGAALLFASRLAGRAAPWRGPRLLLTLRLEDGREKVLQAYRDSGHRLKDPWTGEPLLVVEPSVLEMAFQGQAPWEAFREAAAAGKRVRWVPYRSLGGEGYLLVVPVAAVEWEWEGRRYRREGTWVAVSPRPLDPEGMFQALVPWEWIREGAGEGA